MSKGRIQNTSHEASQEWRKPAAGLLNAWPIVASLAVLAVGLYRAIDLRWICDDAFITLRYVKNFVEGNGLVYNVGERVEGYTHFLWLMIIAASKAIGFDPVDASIWLGIASYVGILVLLLAISLREHKKNPKMLWLPLAAALYALNYDTAEWASGGLETSFYTLLILAAFYLWFYSDLSERRRKLLTGIALALVSLTRPDGVLFTITAVVLLAVNGIRRKQSVLSISKSIGILILPSVVIGVPYLLWKYFYYGDLLPNTYYAKSAGENYFEQGFFYILLYFRVHFVSAIALIAALFLLLRKRQNDGVVRYDSYTGSPIITALAATLVYLTLFVARVGGDFMFARFIIPVVPFIYFVIERAVEQPRLKLNKYGIVAAVLLIASTLVEERLPNTDFFHIGENGRRVEEWDRVKAGSTRFISDERWYYYDFYYVGNLQGGAMDIYTEAGKYLEPFFKDLPVTVAIPGAMNVIAYYANFSTAIDEFGLTDANIAHSTLSSRSGHIGHEKKVTEEYLRKRHADFALLKTIGTNVLPGNSKLDDMDFSIPQVGLWQRAQILDYDKAKFDELSRRFKAVGNESKIPLFENIIPYYVQHVLPNRSLTALEDEYSGFRQSYFDKYPDTGLEHRFEERIAELKRDSVSHLPITKIDSAL